MALSKEEKAKLVKKYARKDGDTGSAEVQIAILTEEIKELTEHLRHIFTIIIHVADYLKKLVDVEVCFNI